VSRILYKSPLSCTNKPNFEKRQNEYNLSSHKGLRQYAQLRITKSKPKTNPNEPNQTQFPKNPKINATFVFKKGYSNEIAFAQNQNEPKQTQSKPNL
jgi:hypothetical protein